MIISKKIVITLSSKQLYFLNDIKKYSVKMASEKVKECLEKKTRRAEIFHHFLRNLEQYFSATANKWNSKFPNIMSFKHGSHIFRFGSIVLHHC